MFGFCIQICQVTAAVAGGLQLASHPGLPLQQDDPSVGIFRSSQSRSHTGCTGADNCDDHIATSFMMRADEDADPTIHFLLLYITFCLFSRKSSSQGVKLMI